MTCTLNHMNVTKQVQQPQYMIGKKQMQNNNKDREHPLLQKEIEMK